MIPCIRDAPSVVRGRLKGSIKWGARDMNKHIMACKTCLVSFGEVKYLNLNFWALY